MTVYGYGYRINRSLSAETSIGGQYAFKATSTSAATYGRWLTFDPEQSFELRRDEGQLSGVEVPLENQS